MPRRLPLQNLSVVITRPAHSSHNICQHLADAGASPIAFPCLEIRSNPDADLNLYAQQLERSNILVFTSKNAVNHAFHNFSNLTEICAQKPFVLAVGEATASALNRHGVEQVITPKHSTDSEALLKLEALQQVRENMIIIIKGVGGRELLYDTLMARGAIVHKMEIYQRDLPSRVDLTPLRNKIDLILFTSSESVDNFLTLTTNCLQQSLLACQTIVGHPRIAGKVSSLGFKKMPIIAVTPSDTDMLAAIHLWASEHLAS